MSGRPPRRSHPATAHRPSRGRRPYPSLRGANAARLVAAAFALLVVCSLLASALGTAVLDGGFWENEPAEEPNAAGDDEFERRLRSLIATDPEDAEAMLSLANLLATTGQVAEAFDWYERALDIHPDNVRTRLDFAQSLTAAGRSADAEVQYREVLAIDDANTDALFYLGELYRSWQPPRLAEAVVAYRRAAELAPDSFVAERANEELARLGATPAASPSTVPAASGAPSAEETP